MSKLPAISPEAFADRISSLSPEPLADGVLAKLHAHYEELRRWAPRLALIGPGTVEEVLERHFGESLAALPWIGESGVMVDVGSGAGFPGLVLAAARPGWEVTLVEARERKWAFLMSVARRAALSCRPLNARVGDPLPADIPARPDLVTARAIRLPAGDLGLLLDRLSAAGRGLFWAGAEDPELPAGWAATTLRRLPGSEARRLVEVVRAAG